ncbi:MAG: type II/IV secretion system protein [Deltaproteobacteria bacterium]|nr:MAG: type II/IV secretion system protein [Deltaproteobacteria bacterium]
MPKTPRSASEVTVAFLAELLLERGELTAEQAEDLREREAKLRERLMREHMEDARIRRLVRYEVSAVEVVAAAGLETPEGRPLNEDRTMQALAAFAGLPWMKLDPLKLNEVFISETLPRAFARRHACLPLRREPDRRIVFAVDNPYDLELLESLRSIAPRGYGLVLTAKTDILRIITDIYGFRSAVTAAEAEIEASVDLGNLEQYVKLNRVEEIEANDKHIVNAVEYLLHYSFDQRASDVHIEPRREEAQIRLRIDGVLHTIYRMPRIVHNAMVSRIKTMARMDIAERRRPQDGRIKTDRSGGEMELRVSSLPVAFGEKVVIRIFDPKTLMQDIEALGMSAEDMALYRGFMARTSGLVLVTGPTGSGKTTTLYSTLKRLAAPEVNITTVEDPIEMVYERFNQTYAQTRIGLGFADVLRSVLRQDPDIIMVGEIRDAQTAQMAVQAALTGHLVFSTLHTNDAPTAVTRLQDLGVPDFLIGSTLVGVVAQRLMRTICDLCREEAVLRPEQAAVLGIHVAEGSRPLPVFRGTGCPRCRGTGLYGRVGIYEVMAIDAGVRRLIAEHADASDIRREAVANGMTTLRESAIRKLAGGQTSFEETLRVLGEGM